MTLLELLRQELPKRGGWPEGVDAVEQDSEGRLFEMDSDYSSDFKLKKCDDWVMDVVTKQQYESALAASQKQAWNGEGLPPVGVECECSWAGDEWQPCEMLFTSNQLVVVKLKESGIEDAYNIGDVTFRPLRTEAERKREVAIDAILSDMRTIPCDLALRDEVAVIYDAIAAGKIPGVKLED